MRFLEVCGLQTHLGGQTVLEDISLELFSGELLWLVGPNGAGKSSLMKSILGLIPFKSERVVFFENTTLHASRKRLAYLPQREKIDWTFPISALEVVLMGSYARNKIWGSLPKAEFEKAHHYLELLGLQGLDHRQISELSGGQQQRLFIARALMSEADLYFLDEPLVGVDVTSEEKILDVLAAKQKEGKAFLVIHHNLLQLSTRSDRVLVLNKRVLHRGFTKDLLDRDLLLRVYGQKT